ncbi:OsmC family protein [Paenibacillus apii]|uniref:OsmC family protein n=1 Tax=Paenibacillus apii TaxID=1850370 RepID=UPI001439ABEF|nr:hypothetical protein [Paenibacillus apii]NJJ37916.1 hypothetical protein [Paenibacillus apii]
MAIVKLNATSVTEGLASTIKSGTHTFQIDEPASQGGSNTGPNPLQAKQADTRSRLDEMHPLNARWLKPAGWLINVLEGAFFVEIYNNFS